MKTAPLMLATILLSACGEEGPGHTGRSESFDAITPNETVHLAGTEPFWSLVIADGEGVYSTPDNIDGSRFAVERFAGLNGLGFSGTLGDVRLDATITQSECSDGMSDRTYPFTATVMLGDDQLEGCGWSDSRPFEGPETP